ncbi:hypothetical protein HZC53_01620 [Candidatus Uhrbacteria bacterium]|nr:hypothetical protein [Candidatus Uhrbacteria bacterium]
MKSILAMVSLLVVSFVVGCSASASVGAKGPTDWRTAYVSGPDVAVSYCDKNKAASEQAYFACLEELQRQRVANNIGAPPPAPPPSATASAAPPVPTTPAAPPSLLPPPAAQPGPGALYIPGASGPVCDTNKQVQLIVENTSDYLIEVRGGLAIAPLGCDAQNKLVRTAVLRRNGQADMIWAIPPHTTAKFVFLPLNGGLGQPEVNFTAYLNLPCQGGVCPPMPAVAHMERQYNVPRSNGQENFQTVSAGYLKNY